MDFVIAIPSYKRQHDISRKTLDFLKSQNTQANIYIFVANREEKHKYSTHIDRQLYHKIVIGKLGLVQQREFIQRYFKRNDKILMMDDDVKSIDLSLSQFKDMNFDEFVSEAFRICLENNSYIWGVYPTYNPYYRRGRLEVSTYLALILGTFYGIINRPGERDLKLTISRKYESNKEDTERSIRYWMKDEKIIRYNRVGIQTNHFTPEGGMGNFNSRIELNKKATLALANKYPELGRVKLRSNRMYEYILKRL